MEYRKRFQVRLGEVDWARVVHFPRIFESFHAALEDFWAEALGRPYAGLLEKEGVGYAVVRIEADFHSSLRYGDAFTAGIAVARLGERSVTWRYRGTREGEEAPFVEARITTACVDVRTWRSRPVPEEHRSLLLPYREEDPVP